MPVIQAKRLKLPHPPVKRSTGRHSRGFPQRPRATWHYRRRLLFSVPELLPGRHSWTSDFNPPRTTTSLPAASSTRVGTLPPALLPDLRPEVHLLEYVFIGLLVLVYLAPIEVSRHVLWACQSTLRSPRACSHSFASFQQMLA